jgi:hypothetical protein
VLVSRLAMRERPLSSRADVGFGSKPVIRWVHSSIWLIACAPNVAHNRQHGARCVLLYCDYAQSCREAGVEPLTLPALQQLIAALTETPHPTIH